MSYGNGHSSQVNLTRVYNSGAITAHDGAGGLLGVANSQHSGDVITITDSFSVGQVTAVAYDGGGLVGRNSADPPTVFTINNGFYDGPGSTQSVCTGLLAEAGTCTRIDTGTTPNYFKGNHTNAPLDTWNFATVWTTVPGGYPILIPVSDGDGIAQAEEEAAPNHGDGNGDGISDAAEPNVTSFVDPVSGHYVTLELGDTCANTAVSAAPESSEPKPDAGYDYPDGLISFTADCGTPGATVTVRSFVVTQPETLTARKIDLSGIGYTTIPDATITQTTIGGQAVTELTYQITDGGPLDQDGTANGTIVDPVGLGVSTVGAPNTGFGALGRH